MKFRFQCIILMINSESNVIYILKLRKFLRIASFGWQLSDDRWHLPVHRQIWHVNTTIALYHEITVAKKPKCVRATFQLHLKIHWIQNVKRTVTGKQQWSHRHLWLKCWNRKWSSLWHRQCISETDIRLKCEKSKRYTRWFVHIVVEILLHRVKKSILRMVQHWNRNDWLQKSGKPIMVWKMIAKHNMRRQ